MIPWQERKQIGFFKALFETIKQVLFKPGEFFGGVDIHGSLLEPYSFYLIIYIPVAIISNYLLIPSLFKIIGQPAAKPSFIAATAPIIGIWIGAAIFHLFVMLLKGKGGFKGTFNVLAYSAPANLFYLIPFIGKIIGGIWGIVIMIIGYKRIHGFSTARAIMAYAGIIIIAVIFLLAAIAVPTLLRARMNANEASAMTKLKTLTVAIEGYRTANNGNFPSDELELKYAKPPYINETLNDKAVNGYKYSVKFMPDGYEITAEPEKCGTTGERIFRVSPGKDISLEEKCYNATATK